jgi:oxygen-independent coproporphyrinogen-3 oxidase
MAGVYISYPFCAQKCTYCNFASGVFPRELETRYLNALESEIAGHRWQWAPDTVYLGGGTPSQMSVEALTRLLTLVRRTGTRSEWVAPASAGARAAKAADQAARSDGSPHVYVQNKLCAQAKACATQAPWREATMEAAPGSITAEKCRAWAAGGINRVSLGVQSFVQRELARTGRKHTAEVVANEVEILRSCGISNINIDLIAGLPGQTIASWRESLGWVAKLAPPHVSVYMLEVDEDSRLGQEVLLDGKRYGAPEVPGDGPIVEMYETAVAELARQGINRYEISNFARPGFESVHNLKYWRLEPYAGFGADAHSFDGRLRFQNVEAAGDYVDRWERGGSPRLESSEAKPAEEKFFVGLRLSEGVRLDAEEWKRFGEPIGRFVADGLMVREAGTIRLTERGILVSNEVFEEFIGIE